MYVCLCLMNLPKQEPENITNGNYTSHTLTSSLHDNKASYSCKNTTIIGSILIGFNEKYEIDGQDVTWF